MISAKNSKQNSRSAFQDNSSPVLEYEFRILIAWPSEFVTMLQPPVPEASFMRKKRPCPVDGGKDGVWGLAAVFRELALKAFHVDFAWCDVLLQGLDGRCSCGLPHVHAAENQP